MQEETILQQIGLSAKESKVYLACLQLGEASVLELAKKSGLKRPHVYNVVESLSALKLLSKIEKQGKAIYLAEEPSRLKELIRQREEKINELLPSLEAFYNVPRGTKPKIKIYQGKEAVLEQYFNMVNYEKIDFFGTSTEQILNTFPEEMMEILEKLRRKKVMIRNLFAYNQATIEFSKKYQTTYNQMRIIPKEKEFFGNNALFGNKLAIISIEHLFMIIIEAENLNKTFQTMFDLSWESSLEPKDL